MEEEFSCKRHGSAEILFRKKKKTKTTQQNYAYQAATFRRSDAGSVTTACSLGQWWIRGVVGLARIANILIGLYHKQLAFSWLTEKSKLILYISEIWKTV